MTLAEFRAAVLAEFGPEMARATPEHVQVFLARMYAALGTGTPGMPFTLPTDTASDYRQVVAGFFTRALTLPRDTAVILLWLFAAEMYYADLADTNRDLLPDLLRPEAEN